METVKDPKSKSVLSLTLLYPAIAVYKGKPRDEYKQGEEYQVFVQATNFCVGIWKHTTPPNYIGYQNTDSFDSEWTITAIRLHDLEGEADYAGRIKQIRLMSKIKSER